MLNIEEVKCLYCPYKQGKKMSKDLAHKVVQAIDKHTYCGNCLDDDISIILEKELGVDWEKD